MTNDNKAIGISPPVLKSKPHEVYAGYGDMNHSLNVLNKHNEHQQNIVTHMTTGQHGGNDEDHTTVVVPQFNTFNPSGPNGSNSASRSSQLTRLTNKQNGWQDSWATVDNEPTRQPPPAPRGLGNMFRIRLF